MKRLLFAAMVLCMGVMAGSCDKDMENSGNDSIDSYIIETSYWAAECSDGMFYLGLEKLPDEAKDNPLFGSANFTHSIMAETSTGANAAGLASQKGNTIEASYIMSFAATFPYTYNISGNSITCIYYDETLSFHQITEQEFYDSVIAFSQDE